MPNCQKVGRANSIGASRKLIQQKFFQSQGKKARGCFCKPHSLAVKGTADFKGRDKAPQSG
jgi:hypothetical protein